ncbi:hypothetical protein BB560_001094 [Smittium megazygosporum]|uniref:Uncharacterized protein n=1 Tax=Smittium megazygosporum TaxID=133381 RepID=A0A2T9ZIJ8_9FUNG|nr:hypothetical protein BB560_001094 [Smittium megazygosporum]
MKEYAECVNKCISLQPVLQASSPETTPSSSSEDSSSPTHSHDVAKNPLGFFDTSTPFVFDFPPKTTLSSVAPDEPISIIPTDLITSVSKQTQSDISDKIGLDRMQSVSPIVTETNLSPSISEFQTSENSPPFSLTTFPSFPLHAPLKISEPNPTTPLSSNIEEPSPNTPSPIISTVSSTSETLNTEEGLGPKNSPDGGTVEISTTLPLIISTNESKNDISMTATSTEIQPIPSLQSPTYSLEPTMSSPPLVPSEKSSFSLSSNNPATADIPTASNIMSAEKLSDPGLSTSSAITNTIPITQSAEQLLAGTEGTRLTFESVPISSPEISTLSTPKAQIDQLASLSNLDPSDSSLNSISQPLLDNLKSVAELPNIKTSANPVIPGSNDEKIIEPRPFVDQPTPTKSLADMGKNEPTQSKNIRSMGLETNALDDAGQNKFGLQSKKLQTSDKTLPAHALSQDATEIAEKTLDPENKFIGTFSSMSLKAGKDTLPSQTTFTTTDIKTSDLLTKLSEGVIASKNNIQQTSETLSSNLNTSELGEDKAKDHSSSEDIPNIKTPTLTSTSKEYEASSMKSTNSDKIKTTTSETSKKETIKAADLHETDKGTPLSDNLESSVDAYKISLWMNAFFVIVALF